MARCSTRRSEGTKRTRQPREVITFKSVGRRSIGCKVSSVIAAAGEDIKSACASWPMAAAASPNKAAAARTGSCEDCTPNGVNASSKSLLARARPASREGRGIRWPGSALIERCRSYGRHSHLSPSSWSD